MLLDLIRQFVSFDKVRAALWTAIGIFVLAGIEGLTGFVSDPGFDPGITLPGFKDLLILGLGNAAAVVTAWFKTERSFGGQAVRIEQGTDTNWPPAE